ncbi:MAG: ABC transporter permease [Deltaproteobacteria bacterium]|nr:ABC transporter permease [Deltaproteobacteria bacterium]
MIIATIRKELHLLARDRAAVFRLLVLPLAFIALFGSVFNSAETGAKRARPIAIWYGAAPLGTPIAAALDGSGVFATVRLGSADEVRARVAAEQLDVGLVIPDDFDPGAGRPAELVIDQGAPLQIRGPVEGAVAAIVDHVLSGGGARPPAVVAKSPPGIRQPLAGISAFQLSVPGNAVLFGFFIALICALSFDEERRTGTWRRLLAAPVPRWKLLIAKLVPYVAVSVMQLGILFGFGAAVFGMKVGGSIPALVVLCVAVACAATSLGLLIASLSATQKQISSLGSFVVLVMGLLGGCMVPRAIMPHLIQTIGLAVPHGWALDGFYTLLVRDGAGFVDVAPQIAAVFGFAIVFAAIGVRRFRFER